MDTTTTLGWLIGLSAWLLLLTVTVALDLKREWNLTADPRIRRLISSALDGRELEAMATGPQVTVRPAEPDAEVVRAIRQAREPMVSGDQRDLPPVTLTGPNELLIPPPMVGGDTLRDWLIHYRNSPEAWMEVTEEFYARAAQDPDVADYFVG
ncbi:MAG TPA: hypothetical protein VHS32_02020, partial [Streptosporangiaceae bacterium]|nr:hypothetical protein [Streptosporangiaceae bacterium]